jgi:hypothetical protein
MRQGTKLGKPNQIPGRIPTAAMIISLLSSQLSALQPLENRDDIFVKLKSVNPYGAAITER